MKGKSFTRNSAFIFTIGIILFFNSCNKDPIKYNSPNILFILADDLGYGDLGCFGSHEIETPNLDQLASEGIQLRNFYASSAVCTPSRVSLLTGKFPIRYNVRKHFSDRTDENLPVFENNLPFMLKEQGYFTAHVGKWHLGGIQEHEFQARTQGNYKVDPGPLQHGFDHYLAFVEDTIRAILFDQNMLYRRGGEHLVRNDRRIDPVNNHWTDIKVQETLSLIEQSLENNKPFFINLWYDVPHTPYEPAPAPFYEIYARRGYQAPKSHYCSMITHMDHGIGKIVKFLKDHGLYENTVIVFTSDNGPAYFGSTGYFKGGKADLHDGGIHVPFIITWPERLGNGEIRTDIIASNVDLLPTFAEVSGADPERYSFDGISIFPYLANEKEFEERPPLFFQLDLYKWYPQPGEKPEPYSTVALISGKYK
ncbi:MAG: sulfatase family protein, partial [Bacteroidales bacterium]